ncbi:MAG: serine hydrolase domain-containing protein [Caulobacteraceae bacterium]
MSLEALDPALQAAAVGEPAPGFVAMVSFADGPHYLRPFGRRSIERSEPMTADTVFWIASCTKLVTSIVALQLVEAGELDLDQPVGSVLPSFADLPILDGFDQAGAPKLRPAPDAPSIRHLLTHTSGLGYAFMDAELARFAELNKVGPGEGHTLPRRFKAGARWQYGASTDWLGQVIEAIRGQDLASIFARNVFEPLGMTDTCFAPDSRLSARLAAMHARAADGKVARIDFALTPPPNPNLGGGGLYSTAPDFMRLLRALLDGQILRKDSRAPLFSNQIGDLGAGVLASSMAALTNPFDPMPGVAKRWSLGMMINLERGPDGRPPGSASWAGLPNCYYWLDPTNGLAAILMAQVLPFADGKILNLLSAFERAVYA